MSIFWEAERLDEWEIDENDYVEIELTHDGNQVWLYAEAWEWNAGLIELSTWNGDTGRAVLRVLGFEDKNLLSIEDERIANIIGVDHNGYLFRCELDRDHTPPWLRIICEEMEETEAVIDDPVDAETELPNGRLF